MHLYLLPNNPDRAREMLYGNSSLALCHYANMKVCEVDEGGVFRNTPSVFSRQQQQQPDKRKVQLQRRSRREQLAQSSTPPPPVDVLLRKQLLVAAQLLSRTQPDPGVPALSCTCEQYCTSQCFASKCEACSAATWSWPGGEEECLDPGPLGTGLLCTVKLYSNGTYIQHY